MFIKNYQMLFFFFLTTGTVVAVSSNSWFTSWLGLEINLMSMIPLILVKINKTNTEASIKYFLPQAMASILIIFGSLIDFMNLNSMFSLNCSMLIIMALSIKAGIAPFHYWFPQVMMNSNWIICFILISWQKIAPFIMLSMLMNNFFMKILILTSILIGSMGGFNQNISKMIITFSSISHGAWMLTLVSLDMESWLKYFIIYSMMSLSIMIFMMKFNMKKISSLYMNKLSHPIKYGIMLMLLSLGGLPPLLGFFIKLNALMVFMNMNLFYISMILISGSLVSLFYYMKIIYTSLMGLSPKFNLMSNNTYMFHMNNYFMMSLIIFLNMIVPMISFLT